MPKENLSNTLRAIEDWQKLLKQFKEKLAQRLWTIPTISEGEKETVFKEYLSDLDQFERELENAYEETQSKQNVLKDENALLRSLMGVSEDDLRTRMLSVEYDLNVNKKDNADLKEELAEVKRQLAESEDENVHLRNRLRDIENQSENSRLDSLKKRENDIKFFSDTQDSLKNQVKDLESRLANLKVLFTENNQQLVVEKQSEISSLQKKLLDEMEITLRKKQELTWVEEDMFAKGIAHKVRTALVSAQGQLYLTLERLGLIDPATKEESFWKGRLKLLFKGAAELSDSFKSITSQLQNITTTLDDYLHLTGRTEIAREPVDLKELVQKEMAEVYVDRKPTTSVEFLSDDPLPYIEGDKDLLQFVVKTLMQNALEALPGGVGKIVINIKNQSRTGTLQLMIKDSGVGIPSHLVPRVFQPFMTTKEGRQGLNLSRAKRYVEIHSGTLDLISTGPDGTFFQMEFPLKRNS